MDDTPQFRLIQRATVRALGMELCRENRNQPAVICYTQSSDRGIIFTSDQPTDRDHANRINQVVEDLTGEEIATIL
jgi:hypothetical protein